MPSFEITALCPTAAADRMAEHDTIFSMASDLAEEVAGLMADAMNTVSEGVVTPTGEGWPVKGGCAEPELSYGLPPVVVVVRMNRSYGGFNFFARRVALHTALRANIWRHMVPGGGQAGISTHFEVRIEFVVGLGSEITGLGAVQHEYGGDTGVTQLELPN